jgi:prepilin peptidase CpaA
MMDRFAGVVLVCFAVAAGMTDIRTRRIPNWLTAGGAALGLGFAAAAGTPGLLLALLGLGVGLAIGMGLFLVKALGAGDAKFMAAVSAWAGWERLPAAYLAMLAGGAAFALAWSVRHRIVRATLVSASSIVGAAVSGGHRPPPMMGGTAAGKFPYAVGLGAGAIAWWFWAGGVVL